MSVVKNKNNTKTWTTDNHIQETTQTAHYREHRSDWATQNSDGLWPIHSNARHVPRKAHTAKKKMFLLKPTPKLVPSKKEKVGVSLTSKEIIVPDR